MIRKKNTASETTLLPQGLIIQFRRRLRQAMGLVIGALGLAFATTLFSYSPYDSSFNTASNYPVHNLLRLPGAIVADFFIQGFGLASIILIVAVIVWGGFLVAETRLKRFGLKLVSLFMAFLSLSTFLGLFANKTTYLTTPTLGGAFGTLSLANIVTSLKLMPAVVGLISLVLFMAFYAYGLGIRPRQWQLILETVRHALRAFFSFIGILITALVRKNASYKQRRKAAPEVEASSLKAEKAASFILRPEAYAATQLHSLDQEVEGDNLDFDGPVEIFKDRAEKVGNKVTEKIQPKEVSVQPSYVYSNIYQDEYQLPSIDFLGKAMAKKDLTSLNPDVLQKAAIQLEQVLQEFGVRGEIVAVCPGPVVTLYELKPAPGIKTSRVIGLADDIARSMSALSARIAVVPGRNVIGIELPNAVRETVYMRDLLLSDEFTKYSAPLALALGKDIGGNPIIADLARMPHLLVAGTTGSGKSVSINTMILSILFRLSPDKCKFIMIDPKMLELSVYDGIPHLLSPVVTEPKKAVVALKWAVREMENRYRAMSKLGVRNIDGYNARLNEARETGEHLMRRVQTGFDPDTGKPIFENQSLAVDPLPYIVIVVDEMADLMLVAGKEIEAAVQRLAQMARAAGIHLIMATQRPSVDVITGTIKANFPTRISFQVTSKIDSRTILGEQGAEQLLGQGDMLYMMGGGRLSRVHGPFVRDEEVEKIVQFLKMQGEPSYIESITEDEDDQMLGSNEEESRGGDPFYQQAIEIIRREGKVSTSFIQRHLQIGYNRAARIIEQMEKEGIVGPANHVGKREIL